MTCALRFADGMHCDYRYVVQYGRVLQRQELDAFLAMAMSPLLHDVPTMQDLKVEIDTTLLALSSAVWLCPVKDFSLVRM